MCLLSVISDLLVENLHICRTTPFEDLRRGVFLTYGMKFGVKK